jgi:hypothetical protein
MASTLPINIPIPAENVLANYDHSDIADGLGYVSYFLGTTKNTAGTTSYNISKTLAYGGGIGVQSNTATFTFNTSSFTTPRVLKGKVIFDGAFSNTQVSSGTSNCFFKVKLQLVQGAVVTDLGSEWTSDTITLTFAGTSGRVFSGVIDVTQTNIKIGDIIRAVLTLTGDKGTASHSTCTVGTDPRGVAISGLTTSVFTLNLPFKIDL